MKTSRSCTRQDAVNRCSNRRLQRPMFSSVTAKKEPRMITTFLLIRHGQCDSLGKTLNGRSSGIHLNEGGLSQAKTLSEELAEFPIRAIYSSPLERAKETLDPLSQKIDIPIQISPAFHEVDFGDWTGLNFSDLCHLPQWTEFNTFRSGTRVPNGELITEVQSRAVSEIETLYHKHWGKTVAIVSHADVIKTILCYYLGLPLDLMTRIEISPASLSIIELHEYGAKVTKLNSTPLQTASRKSA
jgi:probable phosphomutase (TIGR03848 family)